MEVSINKQAQVILDQKINDLKNAGFLVKRPEIEICSSPVSEVGGAMDKINVAVKINIEMYVPDKFVKVEL